jgi:hypothetical protein
LSEHWTESTYVRILLWLGIAAPLGVVVVQLSVGHWSEETWLLLLLGVVNAASWGTGRHAEKHPGRLTRLRLR